ncbi:hypothetical protein NHX12_001115 [Muraenolepis orangiensis]|uniref:T-box transcription factor-associated domain-containing protein n=1 Tax=Muraenolepis orangiensis TaxID=630683 RepID=A0A9Q0DZB0_9TELE|nr:hypothetical protein NHX12_001115 [Muraenolepis orangiensis]
MYTAPEADRLTPSPTDSPRSHQIVPGARYTMQPFFQDQLVQNLPQNRFYGGGERAVPQTEGFLSAPRPDDAASQRWLVASLQQGGASCGAASNALEPAPYEGEYPGPLLPYGLRSLTAPGLSYYPDPPYGGWSSGRGPYQRRAPGPPWSPRPGAGGFPEDSESKDKPRAPEDPGKGGAISAWTDTLTPALTPALALNKPDLGLFCKRRRLSPDGSVTPEVKCEDMDSTTTVQGGPYSKGGGPYSKGGGAYSKDGPYRGPQACYSFYTVP